MVRVTVIKHEQLFITARHEFLTSDKSRAVSALSSFKNVSGESPRGDR